LQLLFDNRVEDYFLNLAHIELLLPLLYLGIVASIGGFFLLNFTLGKLPAHVSSVYANLSTIVAITAGAVFLSEPLEYYHFIGGAMIILGVYGTVWFNRRGKLRVVMNDHIPQQPIHILDRQEDAEDD
jgi:drug/metabolite transporter (DMT)-like permease